MNNFKVIMFDFDNTLVNSLKFWYKSIDKEAFKFFHKKINPEFNAARKGLTNKEIAQCFVEYSGTSASVDEVSKFWHGRMIYYYKNKIKIIAGARELLEKLVSMKYKLVLASATPKKVLNEALKFFDLEKYFSKIYTEDSLKTPKRKPLFYEKLLADLKISANEMFVFEDSFFSLKSAGAVHIKSCALIHNFNRKKLKRLTDNNLLIIKNYKSRKLKKLPIFS